MKNQKEIKTVARKSGVQWWIFALALLIISVGAFFLLNNGEQKKESVIPVEKPSYAITNENGRLTIDVRSSEINFSYKSDEVRGIKGILDSVLVHERRQRNQSENRSKKIEKSPAPQKTEDKIIDKRLKTLEERMERIEGGIEIVNKNIINQFERNNEKIQALEERMERIEGGIKIINEKIEKNSKIFLSLRKISETPGYGAWDEKSKR